MLKNGIFCEMVILVVFKVFLVVKNLEILIQIVPERPIYYYSLITSFEMGNKPVLRELNFSFSTASIQFLYFLPSLKKFSRFVASAYMNDRYREFSNIFLLSQCILFHRLPLRSLFQKFHIFLNSILNQ